MKHFKKTRFTVAMNVLARKMILNNITTSSSIRLLFLSFLFAKCISQQPDVLKAEYDRLYADHCTGSGKMMGPKTSDSIMTQMHMTNNKCFCGYLKSRKPVESNLQSIRTSTASNSNNEAAFLFSHVNLTNRVFGQNSIGLPCTNGFVEADGIRWACLNVDLLSFVSLKELNSAYGYEADPGSDVWGWTDEMNTVEIAIAGTASGVTFVDVTNPSDPFYIGKIPPAKYGFSTNWRDIKVYKNFAYLVSESGTMQYVDMTKLTNDIPSIRNQGAGINLQQYSKDFTYDIWNAHNIHINEDTGFAYIVGSNLCNGGLYMVDIKTPSNPVYAGCFDSDGYTHDVQCVLYKGSDNRYTGREICFACNEGTVTIVDVTNKINPVMLSKTSYTRAKYTHQGWLTEDHNYFIFGDELDEQGGFSFFEDTESSADDILGLDDLFPNFDDLFPSFDDFLNPEEYNTRSIVLEVKDLLAPKIAGYHESAVAASDHNQYVLGNKVYQANYQAGLRILKMNDISTANFTEVGFFDIFDGGDGNGFNGAWSVYPYFPSGTILVNGIEQGLFMLRYKEGPVPVPAPTAPQPPTRKVPTTKAPVPLVPKPSEGCENPETCDPFAFRGMFRSKNVEVEAYNTMYKVSRRFFFFRRCTELCFPVSVTSTMAVGGWKCGSCPRRGLFGLLSN